MPPEVLIPFLPVQSRKCFQSWLTDLQPLIRILLKTQPECPLRTTAQLSISEAYSINNLIQCSKWFCHLTAVRPSKAPSISGSFLGCSVFTGLHQHLDMAPWGSLGSGVSNLWVKDCTRNWLHETEVGEWTMLRRSFYLYLQPLPITCIPPELCFLSGLMVFRFSVGDEP